MLLCGIGALLGMIALQFLPCAERPEPEILIYPDSQLTDSDTWEASPWTSIISYKFVSSTNYQNVIQFYEDAKFSCRIPSQNPNRTVCYISPTDWYSYEVYIDHLQEEQIEYTIEVTWKKRCVNYTDWFEFR